jgi:hypothetical protein
MPWLSLGTFQLTNDWTCTEPVNGEVFRITHQPIINQDDKYLKAVVAQGFEDTKLNIFNPQRLSYRTECEIFTFYFPSGIAQQRFYLKRLDFSNIDWLIDVEVYQSTQVVDDFSNYIITRFGELMPLFNTASNGEISTKKEKLGANNFTKPFVTTTVTPLVPENLNRRSLIIYNPSKIATATIALTQVEGTNNVAGVIAEVAPRSLYELPTSGDGSCFGGALVVKTDKTDNSALLQITEFFVEVIGEQITEN